jgi:hypothetical protein
MAEEKREEPNVAEEFTRLGKQFMEVIRTAWESDDRRRIQADVVTGIQKFGDEITEALQKAADSETGKQFAAKGERVMADVKESGVAEDVREGLLKGLDALSVELGKLSASLESRAAKAPPAEPPAEPKSEA